MNDPIIRKAFHYSHLQNEHTSANTLVVDELGLEHGKCRADIAVINGHLNGYEIKSGKDSLSRLKSQIKIYDAVFDHSSIVLEECHLNEALNLVPIWWGVILVVNDRDDYIRFEIIRDPIQNDQVDDCAVAQLLWKNEAQDILRNLGVKGKQLRGCRENLYQYITEILDSKTLRDLVRESLKKRQDWRRLELPSQYDDSSLLFSM